MSRSDLERLLPIVLDDRGLQDRLLSEPERGAFAALVCELAADRGLDVTAEDVGDALRDARRRWLERWV